MDKLAFLKSLNEKGVVFYTSYTTRCGAGMTYLSPELAEYETNPDSAIAKSLGVSLRAYLLWKEEEFSVRCSALTAKNKRCKNIVTGGRNVTPNIWEKMTGQYCETHENGNKA